MAQFLSSKWRKLIWDYILITSGSLITALGLDIFLIPNRLAPGGVSGLATIVYYLFEDYLHLQVFGLQLPIKVGLIMLIFNIPLFWMGVRVMGRTFGIRTLYGLISLSILTDVLQPVVSPLTANPLLSGIYGGVLMGLGLGLVFKARATTGGTDLVAQLLNKFSSISMGQGVLMADLVVVSLAGIVFNAELALFSIISLYVSSKVIDYVQEGLNVAKAVYIISDSADEIKEEVFDRLERGVTALKASGGFTGKDKDVLLCIISRSQVSKLKRIVYDKDPRAFLFFTEAHEVLGEGFKEVVQD